MVSKRCTPSWTTRISFFLAVLAGASPAMSEMVKNTVPVQIIDVGGQCDNPPDALIPSPNASEGMLWREYDDIPFVFRGDVLPAQMGLGIGIRVRIAGYEPGQVVTVRIEPPVGDVGFWDQEIDSDGTLYFGRVPAYGEPLPRGRYYLQAYDENSILFTYAIYIEADNEAPLCVPDVS